jgi:hypothetical protein
MQSGSDACQRRPCHRAVHQGSMAQQYSRGPLRPARMHRAWRKRGVVRGISRAWTTSRTRAVAATEADAERLTRLLQTDGNSLNGPRNLPALQKKLDEAKVLELPVGLEQAVWLRGGGKLWLFRPLCTRIVRAECIVNTPAQLRRPSYAR